MVQFISKKAACLLIGLSLVHAQSRSTQPQDTWHWLRSVPNSVEVVVMNRDSVCTTGQIKSLSDTSLVVQTGQSTLTLPKDHIAGIWLDIWDRTHQKRPYDMRSKLSMLLYSGRSSWADVTALSDRASRFSNPPLKTSIVLQDGKKLNGKLIRATESEIFVADSFDKETSIPRQQVARIDYVRLKPLSSGSEYAYYELAGLQIFDPVIYPRLFHIADTMPIRVFDAGIPEDNQSLHCKE